MQQIKWNLEEQNNNTLVLFYVEETFFHSHVVTRAP